MNLAPFYSTPHQKDKLKHECHGLTEYHVRLRSKMEFRPDNNIFYATTKISAQSQHFGGESPHFLYITRKLWRSATNPSAQPQPSANNKMVSITTQILRSNHNNFEVNENIFWPTTHILTSTTKFSGRPESTIFLKINRQIKIKKKYIFNLKLCWILTSLNENGLRWLRRDVFTFPETDMRQHWNNRPNVYKGCDDGNEFESSGKIFVEQKQSFIFWRSSRNF